MKWNNNTGALAFSCGTVNFGTFLPYAVIEIDGKRMRISNAVDCCTQEKRDTNLGAGESRLYVNNYGQISLFSRVTVGNAFAILEQWIENRSENSLYWVSSGFDTKDARITEGAMRDYTVYSLHKNEVEGVFSEVEDRMPISFRRSRCFCTAIAADMDWPSHRLPIP